MSDFDDCFTPVDTDCINRLSAEIDNAKELNDSMTRIIQADDMLTLCAEFIKSKNKRRLSVAPDFVDKIKRRCNGKPNVIGGKDKTTGLHLSKLEYLSLTDMRTAWPEYQFFCKGLNDKYVSFSYAGNMLFIKLSKLSNFTDSRYRALIDALTNDDIFTHNARKPVTYKTSYNNFRQILLRDFGLFEYEWGLTFNAVISAAIYPALTRIAPRIYKNTFYLYDGKRTQCKIKAYNITAANDNNRHLSSEYCRGDRLKFEVTYRKEYFIKRPDLTVNYLTFQNDIAGALLLDNKKQLSAHLVDKLTRHELNALLDAACVGNKGDFMRIIEDDRSTQVSTDARINSIELEIIKFKAVISENYIKQNDINNRQSALNAKQAEINADFIRYKNSVTDSRKHRINGD